MTSLYQYTPLDSYRGIRVLELLPNGFRNPHIQCRIRNTNIEAARGTFFAISYTWGSSEPCRTIYCDESNTRLEISLNCYNVLRHVRHQHFARTLWIDAICINQGDIPERSSQVKIMGDIYNAAGHTVVFLGDSTPGSEILFRHLARTDQHISFGYDAQRLCKPRQNIVNELEHLLKRPWFSRIWVVQEAMRSLHITFMCGHDVATFKALMSCLYRYQQNKRAFNRFPAPLEFCDSHYKYLLSEEELTPVQRLYLLMAGAESCESTEVKDRIFALTPLIANRPPRLEKLIDYNRTVNDLFYNFSRLLLSECGLAILWMIRQPRSKKDHFEDRLPSWVPDWGKTKERAYDIGQMSFFFFACRKKYQIMRDFDVDHTRRLLFVTGSRYGSIREVSPVIWIDQEDVQIKIKAVDAWVTKFRSMKNGTKLRYWPDSIMQAFQYLEDEDIANLLRSGAGGGEFVIDDEIASNIAVECNGTRIFITSGGALGRCPKEAQKGDLVVLVNGALEPCILREKNDKWVIVTGYCVLLEIIQHYIRVNGFEGPWLFTMAKYWGQERFAIC
ncbi:heterokaryon incompatibility protein-domain-containing protein [Xylaria flabelliformis]|nr:heterokaryon incompatibility protein-domain-containing protein [Xylaria flabelliformis]